ncbi:hypothetical protein Tco_1316709, partial [Tanacetum coccineum]
FFLGLQVKQQPDGIFISQDKYVADILKKFDFLSIRTATTLIGPDIMFVVYACARFQVTPKALHLNAVKRIFRRLTIVAKSTTEAKYVATDNSYGQVLWIRNQMMDYGFNFMNTKIHIDNQSTISVIKNPVAHSRTKHIEIRFHFIRDCYEKRLIEHWTVESVAIIEGRQDALLYSLYRMLCEQTDFANGDVFHSVIWFWTTAKSRTVNNISYIDAIVVGKPVTILEASIRSDLLFDDVDGIDSLNNHAIFDNIQLMGSVVLEEKESANKEVSTEAPEGTDKKNEGTDKQDGGTNSTKVSTDRHGKGTADKDEGKNVTQTAPTPTPTVFGDDETIAQVLIIMTRNKKKLKEKEKGVELKDVEETERPRPTSIRSILTLRSLPKIDLKDKVKKRIEEEDESDTESEGITKAENKFKQLVNDEEVARKVQEEWEAEEEKKRLAEEEATKVALTNEYDFIQARINADKILAEELQKEEREKFTIEQRAKFLHDTIAAQRKFLAQQRSEAIRNKPPTRNQLRNQMMTYLKHVGGKKHSDLKTKTFEEIQVLYERLKRQDQKFVAIGSAKDERQVKELNKDPKKKRVIKETLRKEDTAKVPAEQEVTEQCTKKRKSGHVKMIVRKRSRPQPDDDSDDEHKDYYI